jgi:hypothetical protein
MGTRLFICALAIAATATNPARAAAGGDASTTKAYIDANYALVAAGHAKIPRIEAAVKRILAKIRSECAEAALESPQDEESTELSNELVGMMVLTGGNIIRHEVETYLRAVGHLHWSGASVNRAVGGYVKSLRVLDKLPMPNLCGDVNSWAASGFTRLPAATARFDRAFIPNWVSLGVLPAGLTRFESPELRTMAKQSARFESRLMEVEAGLVETWGEIMNELHLNP